MKYVKADTVLPKELLLEIQKYIQGEYLYIPSQKLNRKRWGEKTGIREKIRVRNIEIKLKYKKGYSVIELSQEYFLSVDSIKKIIYSKGK